jgi:ectoine hydroxylase-related dioxygenase (phytanoyl-CoA dioxygenase family)
MNDMSRALEALTPEQVAAYRRDGYLVIEGRVPKEVIAACHAEIERIRESARGLTAHTDDLDLEDSHTPDNPRIRRVKLPHRQSKVFDDLMRSDAILAPVRDLIGPNLRLQTSKLNMKSARYGAPVDWHQDWAFYPYTNDDILAVGVFLDDVGPENGPLMVFPGTQKGPAYDHHSGGYFAGTMSLAAAGLDVKDAVRAMAPAGSISIHHVRIVHGSDLNRSDKDRAVLFYEIAAADAFPIAGSMGTFPSLAEFDARLLCGEGTVTPRVTAVPVRIPQPQPPTQGSIYEIQKQSGVRGFERAPGGMM